MVHTATSRTADPTLCPTTPQRGADRSAPPGRPPGFATPFAVLPARAGCGAPEPLARRKLIFAVVSIGLFMSSVDQTIVATGLPASPARAARPGQLGAPGRSHLRPRPGHRHADGRQDQRHVRPQEGVPDLRGRVHPVPACVAGCPGTSTSWWRCGRCRRSAGARSCRRPPGSSRTTSARTETGRWACSPESCRSAGSSGRSWAAVFVAVLVLAAGSPGERADRHRARAVRGQVHPKG